MTAEQEERLIAALEKIADAADRLAPKRIRIEVPRDSTVTRVPNEEDKAKEAQGASDEPLGEWFDIGPREREAISSKKEG